jgi:uncharacterized protein (TIGR03435 family)
MKLIAVLVMAGAIYAQSLESLPKYDAADVHVSPRSLNPQIAGGFMRGGRYQIRNATIVDLITSAYGVDADKIAGGPTWLESDRFDIVAKAPASTTNDTSKLMLRSLLADRFGLVIHTEQKPAVVYALTVGKGEPKMKQTAGGPTGCRAVPQNAGTDAVLFIVAACSNMTMSRFAQILQGAGGYAGDHPVVDQTELSGAFDLEFKFTNRNLLTAAGRDGISLFDALEKQLGLKLEMKTAPAPVIVVEKVNQKPTPNEPDIAQKIPVVPLQFEVANIKPSAPNARQGANLQPGGRIDSSNSLKTYLATAFNLYADMIVGPKWLETQRFDITAKAPANVSGISGGDLDIDAMRTLLLNLLIDRFKLTWHIEDRPAPAFALTAPKQPTKLKKADPTARSSCRYVQAPANSALSISWECHNVTMAQLAEKLPSWANAYITHPAVDLTGIEGGWDFTLSWTPRGAFEAASRAAAGTQQAGASAATDPNGGLTIFEAIEKQLGLKMESRDYPLPVIVIDHMEQEPIEN